MPRRTYDPRKGRRRANGYDGAALQRVIAQVAAEAAKRHRPHNEEDARP